MPAARGFHVIDRLSYPLALVLLPLLVLQGRGLRRRVPKLRPPPGVAHGRVPGTGSELRLGIFGESPAAGIGASTAQASLGPRLACSLASRLGRPVAWQVLAGDGWNARRLLQAMRTVEAPPRLDLAVIALGVNDASRLRTARAWRHDLQALMEELGQRWGQPLVVLVGVPPMDRFPVLSQPLRWLMGARSRMLDQVLSSLAASHAASRWVPVDVGLLVPELFAADGFHPGDAGHRAWAEQIAGEAAVLSIPAAAGHRPRG
ncbi:MAG: SGNH/GDSL hydrolase family protein [Chromatiales bacterium]|nr:SGNH/GDSL hydrolase family protein [Chromatiales bacterium]